MNENRVRIAIDCDDVAVEFKNILYKYIKEKGFDITDLKFCSNESVNYADIGYNLALKIKDGEYGRGILVCGTGIGMAIIANKVKGVYAGVCHDTYSAERLRKSNNAQILTMGAKVIGSEHAKRIIDVWLNSEFEGGRSAVKVETIQRLEEISFQRPV